ncbi:MAG: hypothetical protein KF870_03805 [Leadbetterella sp.]|nr:hypothetical protein [Leadbetterella sp.]
MKLNTIGLICTLILLSCTSGKKPVEQKTVYEYQRSGMVNLSRQQNGLLSVNSIQTAEDVNKAVSFAEINALENILFRGIPGSLQADPIISNEKEAMTKQALTKLIFNEGYRIFMTDSRLIERQDSKNAVTVTQEVTFDIPALRKHLEQNGVIRKFGL